MFFNGETKKQRIFQPFILTKIKKKKNRKNKRKKNRQKKWPQNLLHNKFEIIILDAAGIQRTLGS